MSFYDVAGPQDGLPIVLIHGAPANRKLWTPQMEVLADTYGVIAVDLR